MKYEWWYPSVFFAVSIISIYNYGENVNHLLFIGILLILHALGQIVAELKSDKK